jgi:hypothetical protein
VQWAPTFLGEKRSSDVVGAYLFALAVFKIFYLSTRYTVVRLVMLIEGIILLTP